MDDRVVVVSGANGAIGKPLVEALIRENYIVAVCVRNSEIFPLESREKLVIFECDFADENSIQECTTKIKKNFKSIYGVVNCVGVAHGSSFLMTKPESLNHVFNINYFSIVLFTQQLVRKMLKKKEGAIINLASTAGILADAGTTAYGASKAALIHTSGVMANELGSFGIRVNAIAPAVVESPMADLMDESSLNTLESRSFLSSKIYPKDVVDLIVYMLSDSAKNITGQTIKIDRGITT